MNKTTSSLLLLLTTLFLSSCASILNGKRQTVLLDYPQDAEVYIDGTKAQGGQAVLIRDGLPKQAVLKREGYKDESFVLSQYRSSPLKILSYIPFGLLIVPPVYDIGEKSYNYDKEISLDNRFRMIPEKTLDAKLIRLKRVGVNIGADEMKFRDYKSYKDFAKMGPQKPATSLENSSAIEMENTIFPALMNEVLKEKGYVDTTANAFKYNYRNSINIEAEINSWTLNNVPYEVNSRIRGFVFADLEIAWEITDYYNGLLLSKTISVTSGQFPVESYREEDDLVKATYLSTKDAFESGLLELFHDKEVNKILTSTTTDIATPEATLSLDKPTRFAASLEEAMAATVTIQTGGGHGSGFFIDNGGHIITSYHVVSGSDTNIMVVTNDRQQLTAELLRSNKNTDLALLKVKASEEISPFGLDFDNPRVGSEIYAIGTPKATDLGQTLSKGIISGIRKSEKANYIQTDASINSGNSGGPMVNDAGQLVGVINSKLSGFATEGIGFATPAPVLFESLNLKYN